MSLLLNNSCRHLRTRTVFTILRGGCPLHRISETKFHSLTLNRQRFFADLHACKWKKIGVQGATFDKFSKKISRYFCGAVLPEMKTTNRYSHCFFIPVRFFSKGRDQLRRKNRTALMYISSIFIFMVGMSYAGVPLYRMFCQSAGLGGQAVSGHDTSKVETMEKVKDRTIRVKFNADVHSSMRWNFKPQQSEVKVLPGETALAFYTAKNPTDKPIIGISTYNVVPFEAGQYFNKIQCFCFEEQRLNPHEQVDMPVFFFIDPEFAEDPKMQRINTIVLSYTFFEAKEGLTLPVPSYATT